ncbi:hypothetical protein ACRAWF_12410 [Streptomyces sp. L7]
MQQPRTLREAPAGERRSSAHWPKCSHEVRRFVLDAGAEAADDTQGRFHILNVVEGRRHRPH